LKSSPPTNFDTRAEITTRLSITWNNMSRPELSSPLMANFRPLTARSYPPVG
jgi:hypothetical protein